MNKSYPKNIEKDMMVNLLTTSLFNLASLGSLICNGFFDDNETKPI